MCRKCSRSAVGVTAVQQAVGVNNKRGAAGRDQRALPTCTAAAAAVGFPEREGNDDDDDDVEESERGVRGGSASNHVTD